MKSLSSIFILLVVTACSPAVLDRQLADDAFLDVPLASMVEYPLLYRDDRYLMGGLIVAMKQTERGPLLEVLYIPVNREGYLKDQELAGGRYLALLPHNGPGIDVLTFQPGTYVSIAGVFVGVESADGRSLPLFTVSDIHVWGDEYTQSFGLPPGQPARPPEDRPPEPLPLWENPVAP